MQVDVTFVTCFCIIFLTDKIFVYSLTLSTSRNANPHQLKQCKLIAPRIGHGMVGHTGQFPFMVAIDVSFGYNESTCGGTLITNQFVLTAAHCLIDDGNRAIMVNVTYGANILNDECGVMTFIDVKTFITHEQFSEDEKFNDIALVRLPKPVEFNERVDSACLPLNIGSLTWKKALVAGWGSTENSTTNSTDDGILRYTMLNVLSDDSCNNTKIFWRRNKFHPERQMCAYEKNTTSCQGDSGGPLFVTTTSGFVILGIVSYGYGKCPSYAPVIYTRVTFYLKWIIDTMSKLECKTKSTSFLGDIKLKINKR